MSGTIRVSSGGDIAVSRQVGDTIEEVQDPAGPARAGTSGVTARPGRQLLGSTWTLGPEPPPAGRSPASTAPT